MAKETIDPHDFEDACIAAARTFGRRGEVNVRFEGKDAKTDGNTIFVPALDKSKPLDRETAMIARGYIDHEAGHVRHSDMPLYQREAGQAVAAGDNFYPTVLNAVEDVRIEGCVVSEYPGAQKNLEAVQEAIVQGAIEHLKKDPKLGMDWRVCGPLSIVMRGFKAHGYATPSLGDLEKLVSPTILAEADKWITRIDALPSIVSRRDQSGIVRDGKPGTKDAAELARELCREMHRLSGGVTPLPPPGAAPTPPSGHGLGPTGGGGAGGGVPGGGGAGGGGHSGPEYGSSDDLSDGGGGGGGGGAGGGGLSSTDNETYEDWIKGGRPPIETGIGGNSRIFSRLAGDGSKRAYRAYTTANDKVHRRTDSHTKYGKRTRGLLLNRPENGTRYREVIVGGSGKVSVMSRKLARALLDKMKRGWQRGSEDGSFDNRRLVHVVQGRTNVFKTREDVPDLNTAVLVLIDMSGSMHGRKIALAQEAGICLAEALDKVGVPFAVTGFHCTTGHDQATKDRSQAAKDAGEKYSRWNALDLYVFKDFDETLRQAQRPMGAIHNLVGGDNCDGESLMQAFRLLKPRHERKKVFMVLSDGCPATASSYPDHLETNLRNTVAYIEGKGVTTIGIGIMSEEVKKYYPKWTVLEELDDLPKAVFDRVSRMILGERFKVDNSELMQADARSAAGVR